MGRIQKVDKHVLIYGHISIFPPHCRFFDDSASSRLLPKDADLHPEFLRENLRFCWFRIPSFLLLLTLCLVHRPPQSFSDRSLFHLGPPLYCRTHTDEQALDHGYRHIIHTISMFLSLEFYPPSLERCGMRRRCTRATSPLPTTRSPWFLFQSQMWICFKKTFFVRFSNTMMSSCTSPLETRPTMVLLVPFLELSRYLYKTHRWQL